MHRPSKAGSLITAVATSLGVCGALVVLSLGLGVQVARAELNCTGSSITGLGTTSQMFAQQEIWAPTFESKICNKGSHPTVTYNLASSSNAMAEWNDDGKRGSINTAWAFIGTDLAPTAAQIKNIKSAASGADVVVIPVAQTSIAIVANPPAGCLVEEIANSELASVFAGETYSWNQIATAVLKEGAPETACEAPITRVAPKGSSGVSYNFKNYLYQVVKSGLYCTEGSTEGRATWQELEPVSNGETGAPNTSWPEVCAEKALSGIVRPAGTATGEVVKKVNNTAGSIGFAPLPDAIANEAGTILRLQNNGIGVGSNTVPPDTEGGSANCSILYKVPSGASEGLDVDWSQVFGGSPNVGGESYPLCMLTYALAFHGYEKAGFSLEDERTVHDYLTEYVVQGKAGQVELSGHYYVGLPSSPKEERDVFGAASKAAAQISF
jgi:hypothetical protein